MYPVENNNDLRSRPNENFSDSIRSFGVAIRDPESFIRYLRQEERERLGKESLESSNHVLPKSKFVQMHILSQSDSKEEVPLLNMVVEQDDKMNTNSFMDFMQKLYVLPAYNTRPSLSKDYSALELQEERRKILVPQQTFEENDEVQNYEQNTNSLHKQRLNQRKFNNDSEIEIAPSDPEVGLERRQKEQLRRKENLNRGERLYHQRVETSEPILIVRKFGQRNSDLSRPSTPEFNNSKYHEILMTPSRDILPPPESTFRNSSLTQNTLTFTKASDPKPQNISSLPVINQPSTYNLTRPVLSIPSTEPFAFPLRVYSKISPKNKDISLISVDTSRSSDDINTDTDISHVHIDIPRIYKAVSRPRADVTTPSSDTSQTTEFNEIYLAHFAVPRQYTSRSLPQASFRSAKNRSHLEGSSGLTTVSHRSFHSVDNSRQSTDIVPPLLTLSHEKMFVRYNSTYNSYQNETLSGSGDVKRESNSGSSHRQSADPVARTTKNDYPSLTLKTEQNDSGGDKDYNLSTKAGDRKNLRRKSVQPPINNHIHQEDKYNEVQLTVAETAYYKRRQLARKPFRILETTSEYTQ